MKLSGLGRGVVGPGQGRRGKGRGVRIHGEVQRRVRAFVTDEIRATIIDHVINHGLSLREAGEIVQPYFIRSTVASIHYPIFLTNQQVSKSFYKGYNSSCNVSQIHNN